MDNKDVPIINDGEYKKLLSELKERVRSSQLKAAVKVNHELLDLYWNLGKEIVLRQEKYSWGDAFLSSLSKDLKKRISGHERIFRTKFEKHQILVSILFRLSYSLTACKRIGEYREKD